MLLEQMIPHIARPNVFAECLHFLTEHVFLVMICLQLFTQEQYLLVEEFLSMYSLNY